MGFFLIDIMGIGRRARAGDMECCHLWVMGRKKALRKSKQRKKKKKQKKMRKRLKSLLKNNRRPRKLWLKMGRIRLRQRWILK